MSQDDGTIACQRVEPLLSAWADGALGHGEVATVAAHLDICERCRIDVEVLRTTRTMVRSLPARRLPAGVLTSRVGAQAVAIKPSRPRWRRPAMAAAAIVTVLGATAYTLGGAPEPSQRMVQVPVDVYVADHLVQSSDTVVLTPVLADGR